MPLDLDALMERSDELWEESILPSLKKFIEIGNSRTIQRTLSPVKVVQGPKDDLFSVTAELSNGGVLSSDGRKNIVPNYKGMQDIIFDWQ